MMEALSTDAFIPSSCCRASCVWLCSPPSAGIAPAEAMVGEEGLLHPAAHVAQKVHEAHDSTAAEKGLSFLDVLPPSVHTGVCGIGLTTHVPSCFELPLPHSKVAITSSVLKLQPHFFPSHILPQPPSCSTFAPPSLRTCGCTGQVQSPAAPPGG